MGGDAPKAAAVSRLSSCVRVSSQEVCTHSHRVALYSNCWPKGSGVAELTTNPGVAHTHSATSCDNGTVSPMNKGTP